MNRDAYLDIGPKAVEPRGISRLTNARQGIGQIA